MSTFILPLYVDSQGNLREEANFPTIYDNANNKLEVKRGDNVKFAIHFIDADLAKFLLPQGAVLTIGIKESNNFDTTTPLATGSTSVLPATSEDPYLIDLDLNTTGIDSLLNKDGTEGNDLASVVAMFELSWNSAGDISSSVKPVGVTIYNDVIRGDEGTPQTGSPTLALQSSLQAEIDARLNGDAGNWEIIQYDSKSVTDPITDYLEGKITIMGISFGRASLGWCEDNQGGRIIVDRRYSAGGAPNNTMEFWLYGSGVGYSNTQGYKFRIPASDTIWHDWIEAADKKKEWIHLTDSATYGKTARPDAFSSGKISLASLSSGHGWESLGSQVTVINDDRGTLGGSDTIQYILPYQSNDIYYRKSTSHATWGALQKHITSQDGAISEQLHFDECPTHEDASNFNDPESSVNIGMGQQLFSAKSKEWVQLSNDSVDATQGAVNFEDGKLSLCLISGAYTGTPYPSTAGVLITDRRVGGGSWSYIKQTFTPYAHTPSITYFRVANNGLVWGAWQQVATTEKEWIRLGYNGKAMADLPATWESGVVTVLDVNWTIGGVSVYGLLINDARHVTTNGLITQVITQNTVGGATYRRIGYISGVTSLWRPWQKQLVSEDGAISDPLHFDECPTHEDGDLSDPEQSVNIGMGNELYQRAYSQYVNLPQHFYSYVASSTSFANYVLAEVSGNGVIPPRVTRQSACVAGEWGELVYPNSMFGEFAPQYIYEKERVYMQDCHFTMGGGSAGDQVLALGTMDGKDPNNNATLFGVDGSGNSRYGYALVLTNGSTTNRYTAQLKASTNGGVLETAVDPVEYYSAGKQAMFRIIFKEEAITQTSIKVTVALYSLSENSLHDSDALMLFTKSLTIDRTNTVSSTGRHGVLLRSESATNTGAFFFQMVAGYKGVKNITV